MNTQTDNEEITTPELRVSDWANKYNISADFKFVPFSQSRNAGEKFPSLNWKVTLYKDKLPEAARFSGEIMRFDYSQGSGHAPSYKQGNRSQDNVDKVAFECEHGHKSREICGSIMKGAKIAPPSLADVLYSISMDADAIDFATFEDWASEFGYEKDSRKAEAIYRTCLEYGLKLRSAVGEKALAELRDAVSEM